MADAGAPGSGQRLAFRVVVTGLEAGEKIVVFADGHDRVKVRESALELVAFLGHDAAGDRDRPLWSLPGFELVKLRVDAILGGLPDDASVEDGNVRALERVLLVAGGEKPAGQAFRIR